MVVLLQLSEVICAECDKYYVLFEETENITDPASKNITLFKTPEVGLPTEVITSLNNISIFKECVLSLTSCAPETYCPVSEQLKTNETLAAEKKERDKNNIILGTSVFCGSLGAAAVIYFVARKQGVIQSNTYQFPSSA
ncbi:hypothetical protein O0L34_g4438 [Tuta absoluta]|nr:hypothetical protein O0L34_g4438 [Tuta absoluta]